MTLFFILIILFASVDQIAKFFVRTHIELNAFNDTFLPFLKIGHIQNYGAAFGSFFGMRVFLITFSVAIVVGSVYCVLKKNIRNWKHLFPVSMIIGGAISNLLDRIIYGSVTDYIQIIFFPPICNLGDYFICIGAGILAVVMFNLSK